MPLRQAVVEILLKSWSLEDYKNMRLVLNKHKSLLEIYEKAKKIQLG